MDHENLAAGQTKRGFNEFLPIQYLLDTCATASEAERALARMEHHHVAVPVHLLVADRHGGSFVFEYSRDGSGKVIVHGEVASPLKVTNFQLNRLSDPAAREAMEARCDENGFDRYRLLEERLARTRFPMSEEAIRRVNSAVYVDKEAEEHCERTVFHSIYDASSCSLKVCLLPDVAESLEGFFAVSLEPDSRTRACTRPSPSPRSGEGG
jgi:hypothetical protein